MKKTKTIRIESSVLDAAHIIATGLRYQPPATDSEAIATVIAAQTPDRLDALAARINSDLLATGVASALYIGGLLGCEYGFDLRSGWAVALPDGETIVPLGHADVQKVTELLARRGVELGEREEAT